MSDNNRYDPFKLNKVIENSSIGLLLKRIQKQNEIITNPINNLRIGSTLKTLQQTIDDSGISSVLKKLKEQQAVQNSVTRNSEVSSFLKKLKEQQAVLDSVTGNSEIGSFLKKFREQQAVLDSATGNSEIGSFLKKFKEQQAILDSVTGNSEIGSFLKKFREQNLTLSNYWKINNRILTNSGLNNIINQFEANVSSIDLSMLLSLGIEINPDVQSEVSEFFNHTDVYNTSKKIPEKSSQQTSPIANLIIACILQFIFNQLDSAFFEFVTKPLIEAHYSPKEVKSTVKEEIKKNELNTLYGKRVTLTNLNLRELPKQTATLLEILEPGKILHTIDEPGLHKAWIKIEVDYNGEKTQGYVLRRYTTIIKP